MKTQPVIPVLAWAVLLAPSLPGQSPPFASNAPSVLLTAEGRVEFSHARTVQWSPARTNQALNAGDRLRTGPRSRATVRLSDLSVFRLNELSTLEIRPVDAQGKRALLDLRSGSSYFFNREKGTDLQLRTPTMAGSIRGTEFHLFVAEADGRSVLTMFEGEVTLENAQGSLTLQSGDQGTVEAGQVPRRTAVIDAINVIQWSLYYPAVLDPDEAGFTDAEKQALSSSLEAYRRGDLLRALGEYPAGRQPGSDAERIYLAALVLAVGQVGQAQATLDALVSPTPLAAALRRVIAAVKHQEFAGAPPPARATEWMAASYHEQSRSELSAALASARAAAKESPKLGFAWARVAELEFGFGRTAAAREALAKALELAPAHAPALALQGFVLAAENKTTTAEDYFDRAIAIDGALANAWLGRGLCRIRRGDAAGGRADLQVAATIEPNRALLRSYLGKAFSQAGDTTRAGKELSLAKQADPNDPTAWLYSALLFQQGNRVNEAVSDLERSKELNDNRSVYRSRLLLDQDRAARSANLASIYRDAGMTELSAREATRAVNADYGNYSAHLFLANSYDALRDPKLLNLRYETPWFSELLVANLLAPVGAGSLSPNISQQEYSRFFDGNHLGLISSTEYYSSGAWVQRGSQYGTIDNSSWSLDVGYRSDPGQRPNNELSQLELGGRFKQQITPNDGLLVDVRTYDAQAGDLAQYYSQADASKTQHVAERQVPNLFAGWHHAWGPGSHTLFVAGWLNDTLDFNGAFRLFNLLRDPGGEVIGGFRVTYPADYTTMFNAISSEAQQIWQNDRHTLVAGARFQTGETETTVKQPQGQDFDNHLLRASDYAYYFLRVLPPLQLQAGAAYDYLDFPENISIPPISDEQREESQLSPKAGFYWTPLDGTTVRGAYTRSLGGVFYDTSVRLEPTQLGGFNQAFRSLIPESVVGLVPGTEFETFGVAVDQTFVSRTYVSVAGELLYSDAARTVGAFNLTPGGAVPSGVREDLDFRERSLLVTLNQLLWKEWSAGATYRLIDADLNEHFRGLTPTLTTAANRDVSATLHQMMLFANYHHRCGFFAQWSSIWSQQSNRGYTPDIPGDEFWQHNLYAGYRFLNRRAEIQLGLLNLFDQDYQLNPLTLYSELPRERTLYVSAKFYF